MVAYWRFIRHKRFSFTSSYKLSWQTFILQLLLQMQHHLSSSTKVVALTSVSGTFLADYARKEQFPGYDGKMKMIFRDAELIELPTVQLFAPNQIQILQFLNLRSLIFTEKFTMRLILLSILWFLELSLSLENGGLVEAGGVPENQGR
jgi:hypothetical protein